jgi:hypothetical protein
VQVSTSRSASRENSASSTGRIEEKEQATKTEAVEITYTCAHAHKCPHTQYTLFHGVIHLTHFMFEGTPHSMSVGPERRKREYPNTHIYNFL